MSTAKRVGLLTGIGVLLLVAVLLGSLTVSLRTPVPDYAGRVQVPGLTQSVLVLRDGQGVPQVYADSAADLFFAQGYVTAQDRFYDMDVQRHAAAGELSALLGGSDGALSSDVLARTIGFENIARQELPLLSPRTRDYLQAYSDGVNAYLEGRGPTEVSAGYLLPRVRVGDGIRQWTPLDSLTWLKAMQWQEESDIRDDLGRVVAARAVDDPALVAALDPGPAPAGATSPAVPAGAVRVDPALLRVGEAGAALSARLGPATEPQGGTAVAVSPGRSATGGALLGQSAQVVPGLPGPWYPIGLHCRRLGPDCPFDVAGLSRPGFPAVMSGRNRSLAWAQTRLDVDVTDLVLEDIADGAATHGAAGEPVARRSETIRVADGPDVKITVRTTVHGPVVSDPVPGSRDVPAGGHDVALVWTGLWPGRTAQAIFDLNAAATPADVDTALSRYDGPTSGVVFATGSGSIGFRAVGRIPVRPAGPGLGQADGRWPRPGWDPGYDWTALGTADSAYPPVNDPAPGLVVATNSGGFGLGGADRRDLQGQALSAALDTQAGRSEPLTAAGLAAAQADLRDPLAEDLLPLLQAVPPAGRPQDNLAAFTEEAVDLLDGWDRRQTPDSAAAAYYNAVYGRLLRNTFDDQLPGGYRPDGSARWALVLQQLLQEPGSAWWDDTSTPTIVETRDQIIAQSLVDARLQLTTEQSKRPDQWQWGRSHTVVLHQQNVLAAAGPLRGEADRIFGAGQHPVAGSATTAATSPWDPQHGFQATALPGARTVVDLREPDAGTWVVLGGNSGHPWSRPYNAQLARWLRSAADAPGTEPDDRGYPWLFTEAAVEDAAVSRLVLEPEPAPGP